MFYGNPARYSCSIKKTSFPSWPACSKIHRKKDTFHAQTNMTFCESMDVPDIPLGMHYYISRGGDRTLGKG